MNYKYHYNRLINKAKTRSSVIDGEVHHIIPKCLGGDDSCDNLIKLTYREHLIAHMLLMRIFPKNNKLQYALYKLNNYYGSSKSSRSYERIRKKFIEHQRTRMLINNPMSGKTSPMKGKKHSKKTKKKISDKAKQLFKNKEYRDRHRRGVSLAVSGENHPFYGKHHSRKSILKGNKTRGCRCFSVYRDEKYIGTWYSRSQCCRDLDLKSVGNLSTSIKNGTSYRGYTFKLI